MIRFLRSEAGAIIFWLIASLVCAAFLSPVLYGAGKNLAAAAELENYSGVIEWLAKACGRAKPDRFFSRALLLSALLLLPLLVIRVRALRIASDHLGTHCAGLAGKKEGSKLGSVSLLALEFLGS